ncbi:ABC transporter G family member 23 [Eumeta japonica]|uniref:ABC transporter G family member 23 n=1 Tax=Eumeta variegata TaxID=151549 RepID=A0A4C1SYX3_EUMVA|nr:ABC transporter G family member 23 [Eumeta japonica]
MAGTVSQDLLCHRLADSVEFLPATAAKRPLIGLPSLTVLSYVVYTNGRAATCYAKKPKRDERRVGDITTNNLNVAISAGGPTFGGSGTLEPALSAGRVWWRACAREATMQPAPAVVVRRAVKRYGRDGAPVLRHLDMTVDTGTMLVLLPAIVLSVYLILYNARSFADVNYGLLGPSGCGKTTLLSCIVGRRRLDAGEMWVLGTRPDKNGVPGPKVGYMPQDIALVGEFTVRDAVYYFGRIYAMRSQKLQERFEFLSDLLDLPSGGKLVKYLSGGQQRRVSLAAALVHEPELLILDEPTVGLDPVLRERSDGGAVIKRVDFDSGRYPVRLWPNTNRQMSS